MSIVTKCVLWQTACRVVSPVMADDFACLLTLLLQNTTCPVLANSVDPDQLASEANCSGSALFVIRFVNLYQKPGLSNLIGLKLEVGVAS